MQAIVMEEFGPPEVLVLREVPDPACGPGEALIDVSYSSVTFVETQIRWGRAPHISMLPRLPAIPGNRVAGSVVAAGREVDGELIGTGVVSTTGGRGGDAELMQLAKQAGAFVVAAAGEERKLEVARSLGADLAVNYGQERWTDRIAAEVNGARVDVVFDGVGGSIGRAAFELLRPGGRLCSFGMASGSFTPVGEQELKAHRVAQLRGTRPSPDEMTRLTARALASAAAGALHPVIGQRVPLAQASKAHRAIEDRATIGKTLLVA